MKKLFKFLSYLVAILVLLFAIFVLYNTLADYKPAPIVTVSEAKGEVINVYDTLNVFVWNIGYCGLGDDMSFFYDGGEKTRTSKNRTIENLHEISNLVKEQKDIDFYLFQELDLASHRSYKINQFDSIASILPQHKGYLGLNYKVAFVPVPVSNPLGKVESGLVTFAKHEPFQTDRYSFPGNYVWPKSLFLLDRCFLVQRFYTSNGRELLIINTHNSAYDDGSLRKQQMEMMKNFLLKEYANGNYIMVGGDWNQNPPQKGLDSETEKEGHLTRIRIADNLMPVAWNWHFIEQIPTNRMINEVYNPATTVTTTIDFYLLSPNLKAVSQRNIDLKFKNSDHNPVLLSFEFIR